MTEHRANVLRRVATVVVLVALLSPVLRNQDGLPLSTYPMYAGTRGEVLGIVVATGIALDGSPIDLTMPEIADTRDPLIAQSFLNDAVEAGSAAALCADIAGRVGENVSVVEVAIERHNVIDYVSDQASLVERSVLARCERS